MARESLSRMVALEAFCCFA
ncbi:hypothetical protein CCACVL1_19558 [Corchorus capsularis]|uniref:Uncharacterized protein n=1 Tax=Corchorus capsularis TaxID=210143 RepID=A0A1R3HG22_COCAP|nr:hypothetical protein CCACVL1_19558 [Corchorus capsularis]